MRHLIIPNSFFPRVGGVQTSLLSFIKLLPEDSDPIVALGVRGFKFSFGLKRKFKISEFPVTYSDQDDGGDSKIPIIKESIRYILAILRIYFGSFKKNYYK